MYNSKIFFSVLIMSKVPPERSVFARKKCTCETEKGVKQQKSGEISEGTSMGGTPCLCLIGSHHPDASSPARDSRVTVTRIFRGSGIGITAPGDKLA